jgi:hypothetical protein
MKRAHRLFILLSTPLFIVLPGCRRVVPPPLPTGEDALVVSGLGVPGYCEVGMKAKDIKRKSPFIQTGEWSASHKVTHYRMPVWGIDFFAGKKPVTCLTVTTVSEDPKYPAFKGTLDGMISFANGAVARETVVDIFGQPVLFGDSFLSFPDETRPFSLFFPMSRSLEFLFYLRNGIVFILHNNVVESFLIVQPQGDKHMKTSFFTPSAPPPPSPTLSGAPCPPVSVGWNRGRVGTSGQRTNGTCG